MSYLPILLVGFLGPGLSMVLLQLLYRSKVGQRHMISDDPHRSVSDAKLYKDVALNIAVSVSLIIGIVVVFGDRLFYTREVPLWMKVVEAAGAIFIYDFVYYFVHRYPFHEWKLLRSVHAVHHAARNPRSIDSLLLHPLETVIGLSLFFGSMAAVGGVHITTFAVFFFTYNVFNIFNHAGVSVPHFPLRTLGILAEKHDRHHHSMLSGNYSSISPLPDIVFGTVE